MKRVLLLSENVHSECSYQQKLTKLNCEVLGSSSFFKLWRENKITNEIIYYFQIIIISETISEKVANNIVKEYKNFVPVILRKTEIAPKKELEHEWFQEGFSGWLLTDSSLEELREKLSYYEEQLQNYDQEKGTISTTDLSTLNLSPLESQILSILIEADCQAISRKKLSQMIWEGKVTASTLSQLSCRIGSIKNKIETYFEEPNAIITDWKQGYHLNSNFYQRLVI